MLDYSRKMKKLCKDERMKIYIETAVKESVEKVFLAFDEKLFLALKPPLLPMKLMRFDGCKVGDQVHLDLGLNVWISLITEHSVATDECYFVDEGSQLPFPLKRWRHKHLIKNKDGVTLIIDNIDFSTGLKLLDYLVFPALYFMFWLRKPVYRKKFGEL